MNELDIRARFRSARLLVCDVDGVLTDGGLYYDDAGRVTVRFHVQDGLGLALARSAGLVLGLISGRRTEQAARRAEELGLHEIHFGVKDKAATMSRILSDHAIDPDLAVYVGDDLIDLPAMNLVGLPVAVGDAVAAVRDQAVYVTQRVGGHGAVREVVDLIVTPGKLSQGASSHGAQ